MSRRFVLTSILILLIPFTTCFLLGTSKGETVATVYIDPPVITGLDVGVNFTIDIKVANISKLAGWEIQLFYSPLVLSAISVSEGPFLISVGNTFFPTFPPFGVDNNYNSTHGRVFMACAILGETPGASGNGALASVTFQTAGAGSSAITLPQDPTITKLLDSTFGNPQPIPYVAESGLVSLIANDVAVTNIQLSKTIVSDTQVTMNVTAANLGNYTASFNVTLYYNSTEIATRTITNLAPSTSITLPFTWNTTPIPKGNYTISAYAPPILGETSIENNRLIDGWVVETILGDLNGDRQVNIVDVSIAAKAYGSKPGNPRWNPNADLDNNGTISIVDISKVAKEYGKKDP